MAGKRINDQTIVAAGNELDYFLEYINKLQRICVYMCLLGLLVRSALAMSYCFLGFPIGEANAC